MRLPWSWRMPRSSTKGGGRSPAYQKALTAARDQDQVDAIAKKLKGLGVAVDLPKHFGFIQQWMVAGPFDNRDRKGFAVAYPPEKKVDLAANYVGKEGAKFGWKRATTDDPYGKVDLNKAIAKHMGAVGYAFAEVYSKAEQPVEVRVGSNNAVKLFLNGKEIFFREEYHHGYRMDQHVGRGTLKAGTNEILIKVCQNEQKDSWARPGRSSCGCAMRSAARCRSDVGPKPKPAAKGRKNHETTFLHLLARSSVAPTAFAADWTQFRGPGGSGVSEEKGLPVQWSVKRDKGGDKIVESKNVRWIADLPGRGLASPVIVGNRAFVIASSGFQQSRLHVLCFDTGSGKKLWERQFWSTGSTTCHPKTNMAAPTPATDGQRLYALFATCDLVCLDLDGNLVWLRALGRDYPTVTNQVGMAASPVLAGNTLVVQLENAGESFAAGIDKLTGKNRWKIERSRDINWVTPLALTNGKRTEVVLQSGAGTDGPQPGNRRQALAARGQVLDHPFGNCRQRHPVRPRQRRADRAEAVGRGRQARRCSGPRTSSDARPPRPSSTRAASTP